jgi:hypothetical protein
LYDDGSGERFRWDEERVPYGLLGDQAGLASPLAIPLALGVVVVVVEILNPLEVDDVASFPVVELDRDKACGGWWL